MSPAALKWAAAGVLALLLLTAGATWKVQDWRYGKQLAEQSGAHKADLTAISNAAAAQVRADQDKRLALEQRLAASDQTHHEALTNAQKDQARLRDRLATADLRLSVLLAEDSTGVCSVPAGTETGVVVHGGARARLDPAHAQRIIAITDAGDQGLIALRACQAYVRAVAP
ncbi:lysis protein [Pseudomonas helleri]|uniref:lysis protein n=1 Tax=Pseudomonas helleri TaxID=1608996 RepID=UPI003F97D35F